MIGTKLEKDKATSKNLHGKIFAWCIGLFFGQTSVAKFLLIILLDICMLSPTTTLLIVLTKKFNQNCLPQTTGYYKFLNLKATASWKLTPSPFACRFLSFTNMHVISRKCQPWRRNSQKKRTIVEPPLHYRSASISFLSWNFRIWQQLIISSTNMHDIPRYLKKQNKT